MAMERLWFNSVVESVFSKGLGDRLTPELKAEIRAAGINLDKLELAYSMEVVERVFALVLKRLYPNDTPEHAYRDLGMSSLRGYSDTLLGKALMQILKVIGVQRSLLRMHTSMRSGNNYMQTISTVISPRCIDLTFSDVSGMPTFYQGLLEEGGRMAHAKNLVVTPTKSEPPAQTYRVEWTD